MVHATCFLGSGRMLRHESMRSSRLFGEGARQWEQDVGVEGIFEPIVA